MRIASMALALVTCALAVPGGAQEIRRGILYRNPQCGCCENYANYLKHNGFEVQIIETDDLPSINRQNGVDPSIEGCHTMLIDGYVVGGHVPVDVVNRLLAQRPPIKGISLPGMPQGSPGMGGSKQEPFAIYEVGTMPLKIYVVE